MNIKEEFLKAYQNFVGATAKADELENKNDGKIYDKSNLKISDKVVGSKVELINDDKSLSDAPDGDYTLSNGDVLTIKDSLIEAINGQVDPVSEDEKKEELGEEIVEDDTKETPEDEVKETPEEEVEEEETNDQVIANLESTVQALSEKLDGLVDAVAALSATNMNDNKVALSAFSAEINELKAHVKFMAKIPLEGSKTSKSNIVKDDREKQMLELGRLFKM